MFDFIITALVIFGIGMGIRALVRRRKRAAAPPAAGAASYSQASNSTARAKFCPQCGTPVSPDSAFCANCGAKVE